MWLILGERELFPRSRNPLLLAQRKQRRRLMCEICRYVDICPNTVQYTLPRPRCPALFNLQNCQRVRWTGNPSMHIQRRAGQEKAVFIFLLTHLCQLLQVPELTDRRSPHREEVVVQSYTNQPFPPNPNPTITHTKQEK